MKLAVWQVLNLDENSCFCNPFRIGKDIENMYLYFTPFPAPRKSSFISMLLQNGCGLKLKDRDHF